MAGKATREKRIAAAIQKLQDDYGRVDAHIVIKAAKNPKHPLHGEFQWNLKKAAYAHWVHTANELIRVVTVVTVTKSHRYIVPMYVRDPMKKGNASGMIAVTSALIDRRNAEKIMRGELDRCAQAIERARGVVGALERSHKGLADKLEKMLADVIAARDSLREW